MTLKLNLKICRRVATDFKALLDLWECVDANYFSWIKISRLGHKDKWLSNFSKNKNFDLTLKLNKKICRRVATDFEAK